LKSSGWRRRARRPLGSSIWEVSMCPPKN
jgi:hypothetical protein